MTIDLPRQSRDKPEEKLRGKTFSCRPVLRRPQWRWDSAITDGAMRKLAPPLSLPRFMFVPSLLGKVIVFQ